MIRYPIPLPRHRKIAITAPSSGIGTCTARYQHCKSRLTAQGHTLVEGHCLFDDRYSASAPAIERAQELVSFWKNDAIDLIYPPWGGEHLVAILEHLDFSSFVKSDPKWIMGYSDISLLLFVLTTHAQIATAHGTNFMEYGGEDRETLTAGALDILEQPLGATFEQRSASHYVTSYTPYEKEPTAWLNVTEPVRWRALNSASSNSASSNSASRVLSGRMIGGCLEVLGPVVGTRFDAFSPFARSHSAEGVLLYLENCALSVHAQARFLFNLKYAGWFDCVSGVAFGRNAGLEDDSYPYTEMLEDFFGPLDLPVLYDLDIGHRQPNLTIINGSLGQLTCFEDGTGSLVQKLVP